MGHPQPDIGPDQIGRADEGKGRLAERRTVRNKAWWLVRIKDVLKNGSSKKDDVQSGMDNIENTATVLESLPPMIVREVRCTCMQNPQLM